ncbi:39S ribosomal protein L44, mitochondrial [Diprion similis]|uniref:39S ribosomal protein L44, mitochondrial n=1 Tax=Diprion similis TaxID=362088 RepID=UPI001EF7A1B1|nr:39S ribosomal protein L44, mitochondrial [Diprion similis]
MSSLRTCARAAIRIQRLTSVIYSGERGIKRWVAPTLREINKRKAKLGPQPEPRRSNFLDWNYNAEIFAFNKRLSENFDAELLEQAFTHRSYVAQEEQKQREVGIENPELNIKNNTDLIEEGKCLTSEIVQCYLRQALPRLPEEGILKLKDYLLSEEILAKVSIQIGTKDLILSEDHPVQPETLVNTFFALVAALARSSDAVHTSFFVRDFLIATLSDKEILSIWTPSHPFQTLDAILNREKRGPADFRLTAQTGVNTVLAAYQVAVYSDQQFLGIGAGETVQVAKNIAALDALQRMFGISDFSRPIPFNLTVDVSSQRTENLPLTKWCTENLKNIVAG